MEGGRLPGNIQTMNNEKITPSDCCEDTPCTQQNLTYSSRVATFGPAGNTSPFPHTYQAMKWLAEQGLDAFEYSAGRGVSGSLETFAKIGDEARAHNIKMSFHAPYFISLTSTDPAIMARTQQHITKSIAAAQAMDADIIVIHPGGTAKMQRSEALRIAKDALTRALEAHSDSTIRLGIETMGKIGALGTLDEVLDMCSLDKRVVPVVDFGHIYARERGAFPLTHDDYSRIFDTISTSCGADIAQNLHCHFSRIEYTAGGEKQHHTFADTQYGPEYSPLIDVIAREKLTPRIICESAGTQAQDALEMKRYYEQKSKS